MTTQDTENKSNIVSLAKETNENKYISPRMLLDLLSGELPGGILVLHVHDNKVECSAAKLDDLQITGACAAAIRRIQSNSGAFRF